MAFENTDPQDYELMKENTQVKRAEAPISIELANARTLKAIIESREATHEQKVQAVIELNKLNLES